MINGHAVNNFFVVKNGRFGAIHFEGSRNSEDDFCCTERSDLPIYDEIPKPVCDVPCEYDYFHSYTCGESVFFNQQENVYLHVDSKNTVIHFEEMYIDEYSSSFWGKKNNTLYLV